MYSNTITTNERSKQMTLDEFREYQQAQYAIQREANKAKIEAMFSTNSRPLNNAHLLTKEEN
jgi:hypothetical protein